MQINVAVNDTFEEEPEEISQETNCQVLEAIGRPLLNSVWHDP